MTYWQTPQLNRLNASNDALAKTVNPTKFESGRRHTVNSKDKHYAVATPGPS